MFVDRHDGTVAVPRAGALGTEFDEDHLMRAVILAGGLGTRLRPYTTIIPKPLVPVGDRPILQHIIERLCACGVGRVDLCVNYLGGLIQTYFSRMAPPEGVELHWHWEDEPLGTAGALRAVPDLEDTFIAMNGDVFTSLDYGDLAAFHQQEGAALTIAMHKKQVQLDLGVIQTDGSRVIGYREKPALDYEVSMGVYVYEPRALRYLPEGVCQFPELVLRLLRGGERIAAYRNNAAWYDIGTPSEYERAMSDMSLLTCFPSHARPSTEARLDDFQHPLRTLDAPSGISPADVG